MKGPAIAMLIVDAVFLIGDPRWLQAAGIVPGVAAIWLLVSERKRWEPIQ